MFTLLAAAAPGRITAIVAYWIRQDGERLTKESLHIVGGMHALATAAEQGVKVDKEAIEAAYQA